MSEKEFMRKFYLRSVEEWLEFTVAPLRSAQRNVSDALGVRGEIQGTGEGVALAELENALATALAWVSHAQVLAACFFDEAEAPAEVTVPKTLDVSLLYCCDVCDGEWAKGEGVQPGEMCPLCEDGTVDLPVPF